MRMLLAGGGTGGHLFPAVAIAEELLRQEQDAAVHFVGTARGLEARLLPQLGLPLELIDMAGLVGRGLSGALQLGPKLARSLRQSLRILRDFAPDLVIGVGGYASFPVLLAAGIKGIPVVLHEQNAQPGLSNRVLARFARRVCLSIQGSGSGLPERKLVMTGNPLRQGVVSVAAELPQRGKLLVFGGSRGAHAINELMVETLPLLRAGGMTAAVVHQTGEDDAAWVEAAYLEKGVRGVEVVPFIGDMGRAYAEAGLVLCRAGATTIAELCACGRPAVLIPFPYAAADHQTANARALESAGAARLLPQQGLGAKELATEISGLWADRDRRESMAAAARGLGHMDAAARVVEVCRQVLSED